MLFETAETVSCLWVVTWSALPGATTVQQRRARRCVLARGGTCLRAAGWVRYDARGSDQEGRPHKASCPLACVDTGSEGLTQACRAAGRQCT